MKLHRIMQKSNETVSFVVVFAFAQYHQLDFIGTSAGRLFGFVQTLQPALLALEFN